MLAAASPHAFAGVEEDELARNAVRVVNEMQVIPESAIPDKLLDEAHAIAVIPDSIKAGLIIGGRRGHGLLSVKTPEGTWSNPSFITLTGGSIGFQAGVQSADIVLVFSSQRGLDGIVNGKITLGADAGVAAGPVGRHASVATDGAMKAEIWSWSRARGLFAGVALDGAVLSIDDDANTEVYGAGTTPRMIFEGRAGGAPSEAITTFRKTLADASAAAAYARGTGVQAQAATAPVQAQGAVTTPATTTPAVSAPPAAQPGTFEPVPPPPAEVDDNPATVEPLP
ncbi:MAG TPA: lipid-binding SYLF domain-containing protein [Xanthomonadaceae bacterium]|nr:lipid-binding SYLF domain-containing protein [Xanthomonadaceae bacterium]